MVLFQNARDKCIHFHGVPSCFYLITKQTRADQLQKTEEVRPPSESKYYSLKNVSYPLYIIYVPEIYDLKYKRSIVFAWRFKLYKSLRTKITFFDFKIYQVFGFCPHNASIISIFHNSSKIFTYCGVVSLFSTYPPDFEVIFELHIGNVWYVKLDTIFDLISANVIENYKLEYNKFYKSVHVYHLKLIMTCIATYKIVVEKYQKIVLYAQITAHTLCTIYNGPGYLTQKTILQSSNQLTVINSFQIIVEFITNCANRSDLNRDFFFTYSTRFNNFYTEVLSEIRLKTSISFSSKGKGVSSIVLFRSPNQSSVNVTIVHYNFQGVYDPNCPYGAVSFFEESYLKNITEIKSICSSSIERHFQNVYSSTGRMLIVFYAYKEYSSLNVIVNVSYTRCQSVRIQSYILFEICLQHYKPTRTREGCWKDQQYTLLAMRDKRLKTRYPQMHVFGHAPSEGCIILQMTNDPQSSHPQHTHLYHKSKDSHGCSFYLNFKTSSFYSMASWWSFRITGFFSHSSRFHIVREPQTVRLEKIYEIDNQGDRSKGVFDYDNCSNNIRNIKPMPGKDIAIDLVHYENAPENLLYFVYFNVWTKDNINPSWLDILVTMETNNSITSAEHLVILDKIPYEFNRVGPSSDQFIVLSFPKLRGNSSILSMQAVTDHSYFSEYKILWDKEYLVVHWAKMYHIKANQNKIAIALPGPIRNITAQNLDENNLTISFNWKTLPQQMNVRTHKFCKRKLRYWRFGTSWTGYDEFRVECHSFKMPLNYYYIEKVVPHLSRPNIGLKYHIGNYLYRNSRVSCVRGMRRMTNKESWINAAKTCKRKGMSLPEFLSRRDQEELLYLLKSTSIFPVKALFIGLYGSSG